MPIHLDQEFEIKYAQLRSRGPVNPWQLLDPVFAACKILNLSIPNPGSRDPGAIIVDGLSRERSHYCIVHIYDRLIEYQLGSHLHWMTGKLGHGKAAEYAKSRVTIMNQSLTEAAGAVVRGSKEQILQPLSAAYSDAEALNRAMPTLRNLLNKSFINEVVDMMDWFALHVAANGVIVEALFKRISTGTCANEWKRALNPRSTAGWRQTIDDYRCKAVE